MAMTIGRLIDALAGLPPSLPVEFDFGGLVPTTVASWRGIYAHAALGWLARDAYLLARPGPAPTVETLLAELRLAVGGRPYLGWKGGEYVYDRDTPLHVDNPGECTHTELTRVESNDWSVILHTAYEEA